MYLFQIHDCYNRLNWDPNRLNLLNNNTINKKRNYAKYNMSTPMFKYTSSKKNEGEGVLYPYASLAVQFTDLHQATLLYRAILRPSQHHTFPCLHHTLVSYLDTHAHTHTHTHTHTKETLISSYVVEEVFSILSALEQGKQPLPDVALPWKQF